MYSLSHSQHFHIFRVFTQHNIPHSLLASREGEPGEPGGHTGVVYHQQQHISHLFERLADRRTGARGGELWLLPCCRYCTELMALRLESGIGDCDAAATRIGDQWSKWQISWYGKGKAINSHKY